MSSASLNKQGSQRRRGSLSESSAGGSRRISGIQASSLAFGGLTLSSLPQHRRASRDRLSQAQSLSASRGSEKALAALAQSKLPSSSLGLNNGSDLPVEEALAAAQNRPLKLHPAARGQVQQPGKRQLVYSRQVSAPAGHVVAAGGQTVNIGHQGFTHLAPQPVLRPAASYRQLREYFMQRQKFVVNNMHLMPQAPDGGYGWIIVCAAFLTSAIVEGVAFSFAPMLIHLVSEAPHQMLSILFMGATLIATYLLMCPLAMALVNAYGTRRILFVGSLISTVGFIIPYYVYAFSSGAPLPPHVPANASITAQLQTPVDYSLLIISYGCIAGVGFGLMYMAALVAVSQYFELNRALAMGIALCGAGAGTLILPPILSMILDGRGFDGAVATLAGLTANGLAAALLMRPLKHNRQIRKKPRKKNKLDRLRELQREVAGIPPRSESEQSLASQDQKQAEEAVEVCRRLRIHQLAVESGLNSLSPSRGELASIAPTEASELINLDAMKARPPLAPQQAASALPLHMRDNDDDVSSTPPQILVNDTDGVPPLAAPRTSTMISNESETSQSSAVVTSELIKTLPSSLPINVEDPGDPDPYDSITKLKAQLAVVLPPPQLVAAAQAGRLQHSKSEVASPKWSSGANVNNVEPNQNPKTRAQVREELLKTNRRFQVKASQHQPLLGSGTSTRLRGVSVTQANSRTNSISAGAGNSLSVAKQRIVGINGQAVSVADISRPMYRMDIMYGRSITHLPKCQSEADLSEYRANAVKIPDDPVKPGSGVGNLPGQNLNSMDYDSKSNASKKSSVSGCIDSIHRALLRVVPKPLIDPLRHLVDTSLLTDSAFLRMAVGSALCMMAVPLPYFVLPWRALVLRPQRLDEDPTSPLLASCLISIIGGASMAGRLVSGFVADLPNMNTLLLHNCSLMVTTVATFMAHMANQYAALCVYAGIFGFCYAFHMSLASTVLGETVGVERLTSAYGLITIFRGLAPLCTIPLLTLLLGDATYCVAERGQGNPDWCAPLPANSMPRAPKMPDPMWWARVPHPPNELEISNFGAPTNITNGYHRVLWLSGSLLFVASALFASLHLRPTGNHNQQQHNKEGTRSKQNSQRLNSESSGGSGAANTTMMSLGSQRSHKPPQQDV